MLNRLAIYCGYREKPSRCIVHSPSTHRMPPTARGLLLHLHRPPHTKKEPLWREGNGAIVGKRRSDPELLSAMKRQRHPSQAAHPSTRLKMKMISCLRPFTSLSRLKTMSSRKFAAWFNNYGAYLLNYRLSSSNETISWIKLQSKMKFPTENPRKPGNWNPPQGRYTQCICSCRILDRSYNEHNEASRVLAASCHSDLRTQIQSKTL